MHAAPTHEPVSSPASLTETAERALRAVACPECGFVHTGVEAWLEAIREVFPEFSRTDLAWMITDLDAQGSWEIVIGADETLTAFPRID